MSRFDGRIALITGAAGGIGSATAERLVSEGAKVALVDRDQAKLDTLAARLGADNCAVYALDVSDEIAVSACVQAVVDRFGALNVLFNNAGIVCKAEPVDQQDIADWQRVIGINLIGPMLFIKHAAKHLIASKGAIVNTASVAGIRAGAGGNAYSASKAAVISLTQTTACDFGSHGVRVNAVCPGLVETGMTQVVFDYARRVGKEARLGERCELRRYGKPSEIAAAVAFLASDDASYITGQALAVDGGNTASLNLPGMKY